MNRSKIIYCNYLCHLKKFNLGEMLIFKKTIVKKIFICIVFFLTGALSVINAQYGNIETRAREELLNRGLDENEVRQRLIEKGINISNLDPNDPSSMLKAQQAMEEVLQEIESSSIGNDQKQFSKNDTLKKEKIIAKNTEEIAESVKEGSSIEEAVSETLTDASTNNLRKSKIYGQEIFRTQSIKLYRQSKDIKPPQTYVLGAGDIIGISIWGNSEFSQIYTINKDGYIKPRGMPRLYLKGIKYGKAKHLLQKQFHRFYSFMDNEFEVSLNFSRTINVNIVGEVFNFGSFNIPAINNAFNALVAAGGPTDIGSVRNIQLIRPGQQNKKIDIYKYLMDPSIANDFYIEENDIIYVPVAEKLIEISGAINKPFIYELLPNENLRELIKYAGGLKPNAIKKNIQILRYENDEQKIIDLNWSDYETSGRNFTLMSGDKVIINIIPTPYENIVKVTGAIEIPGIYAFKNGERISSLLKKLQFKDAALLELSYLKRLNDDKKTVSYIKINLKNVIDNPGSIDDIILQKGDILVIFDKGKFKDASQIVVAGAVRSPDTLAFDTKQSLRVSDALFMCGGLRQDASNFGYIKRKNPDNPKSNQYIKLNLSNIQNNLNDKDNIILNEGDYIYINSWNEFTDSLYIQVSGLVRNPRKILYDPSLDIETALLLSGGLRYGADNTKIDLFRMEISPNKESKIIEANIKIDKDGHIIDNNLPLMPYDEIVVRKAPNFDPPQNIIVNGSVKYPGKYTLIKKSERLSNIIERAGGLSKDASIENITIKRTNIKGFIVSDYKKILRNPGSPDDIILQDGDIINIPKLENIVTIMGFTMANEVYKNDEGDRIITVPYQSGKNALYYIDKYAGGVSSYGDKSKITVIEKNGHVKSRRKFLFFNKYPVVGRGATIYVPSLPPKENNNKENDVDWNDIISKTLGQATSILTFLLLLQRVN